MAHSKYRNAGQRQASIRKALNRTANHQAQLTEAAALGITILALQTRKWRELVGLHETWKAEIRQRPPERSTYGRYGLERYYS